MAWRKCDVAKWRQYQRRSMAVKQAWHNGGVWRQRSRGGSVNGGSSNIKAAWQWQQPAGISHVSRIVAWQATLSSGKNRAGMA